MKFELEINEKLMKELLDEKIYQTKVTLTNVEKVKREEQSLPETMQLDFVECEYRSNIAIFFDNNKCFYIDEESYGINNNTGCEINTNKLATFKKKKFLDLRPDDAWCNVYADNKDIKPFNIQHFIKVTKDNWIMQSLDNANILVRQNYVNPTGLIINNSDVWVLQK